MAGQIDMEMNFPMGSAPSSQVQQGGGSGTVDMYGGEGISLGHTPVPCTQRGGGGGTVDMNGGEGVSLSRNPSPLYGQIAPTDKGE